MPGRGYEKEDGIRRPLDMRGNIVLSHGDVAGRAAGESAAEVSFDDGDPLLAHHHIFECVRKICRCDEALVVGGFFGTLILADAAFRVYDRLSQFERCFEIAAMYGVDLQFGQARIVSGHQFLHEDILVGHRNIRLTE